MDQDGRALFEGLAPGHFLLNYQNTRAEVDIVEGESAVARIVRGLGPRITGLLLDSEGRPKAGEVIALGGSTAGRTKTDARGRFHFEDLSEGWYQVYLQLGSRSYSIPARIGEDLLLRIRSGPGRGVLVVRAPGFAWTAVPIEIEERRTLDVSVALVPSGGIRGRVEPALGARGFAIVERTDGFPWTLTEQGSLLFAIAAGMDPRLPAPIAADGSFSIPEVPPGSYRVRGVNPPAPGRDLTERASAAVEVRSGVIQEVVLRR